MSTTTIRPRCRVPRKWPNNRAKSVHDSSSTAKDGSRRKGHNIPKQGTHKCQGTTQGCQCRQTTPMPQACDATDARRPIECPHVLAYDRVVVQLAMGVRCAHTFDRGGSVARLPTQHGCSSCVPCTQPRCACAPHKPEVCAFRLLSTCTLSHKL